LKLGLGIVKALITTYSARVIVLSRNSSKDLESLPSSSLHIIKCDITEESIAKTAINETMTTFGRLDSIVLNAGTLDPVSRLDNASASAWRECFDINVFSNISLVSPLSIYLYTLSTYFHTLSIFLFPVHAYNHLPQIKESIPHLRESHGSIILISSGAATNAYSGWSAYSASKATINSLAKSLACEEPEITTLAVRPGVVDTEMQKDIRTKRAYSLGLC
jgi:NAD(P)-dependent dehydrogenase (short-subunit alcohol dehydrogenase family)